MAARHPRGSLARQIALVVGATRACEVHFGVVVSHQTGPPNSLTVLLDGATGTANQVPGVRYLASYSPTAADTVVVLLLGADNRLRQCWLVAGKLA
jgi:hypothetical protein